MKLNSLAYIITAIVLVALAYAAYNQPPQAQINDFDSCAKAQGSVIMESYPEQCRAEDGRVFENEEQRRDIDGAPARACITSSGNWLPDYQECEGISQAQCTAAGGDFNECASACRHNPDPGAPCILLCVQVCSF